MCETKAMGRRHYRQYPAYRVRLVQRVSGRKNREDLSPLAAALYIHVRTIDKTWATQTGVGQ